MEVPIHFLPLETVTQSEGELGCMRWNIVQETRKPRLGVMNGHQRVVVLPV